MPQQAAKHLSSRDSLSSLSIVVLVSAKNGPRFDAGAGIRFEDAEGDRIRAPTRGSKRGVRVPAFCGGRFCHGPWWIGLPRRFDVGSVIRRQNPLAFRRRRGAFRSSGGRTFRRVLPDRDRAFAPFSRNPCPEQRSGVKHACYNKANRTSGESLKTRGSPNSTRRVSKTSLSSFSDGASLHGTCKNWNWRRPEGAIFLRHGRQRGRPRGAPGFSGTAVRRGLSSDGERE